MQNTVYFGDRKVVIEKVKKELGDVFKNAIVYENEKMQLSVFDIRQMRDFCYKTSEGVKHVFLSSFYWSDAVQNAMLKVLEDTPPNTFIYLFGPAEKYFLPTVLSRIQKVLIKNSNRYLKDAAAVLALDPNERLSNKIVMKVLGLKVVDVNYEKNTENEKKDRESHLLFLWALMDVVMGANLDKTMLEKINTMSQMADIEGGNPTLFIEWLLLSTPKIMV